MERNPASFQDTITSLLERKRRKHTDFPELEFCKLCLQAVSYTHLDVYKRQIPLFLSRSIKNKQSTKEDGQ